jgi:hypothetical protein
LEVYLRHNDAGDKGGLIAPDSVLAKHFLDIPTFPPHPVPNAPFGAVGLGGVGLNA